MSAASQAASLEEQIGQWRSYLSRRKAIHAVDLEELEDHLREQVAALVGVGLATDEAFLAAVKRMGSLDSLSREFVREHSDRLWKQLVVVPPDPGDSRARAQTDAVVAFCLAVAAAALIKVPALFGIQLDQNTSFYARNLSLFVLPLLTGYFAWKRGSTPARSAGWPSRSSRRGWLRTPIPSPPAALPRRSRRCTCRSRSGWWWASGTPAAAGARLRAAWTSFDFRANYSSTTS